MRRMQRVTGRTDDMMIVRGVNVFPSQIEEQIFRVKGLAPHYQIVLTREERLDELEVLVEASPLLAEAKARQASAAEHVAATVWLVPDLAARTGGQWRGIAPPY